MVSVFGLGIALVAASTVSAANKEGQQRKNRDGNRENRSEMHEVFEQKDFDAWKSIISEKNIKNQERHQIVMDVINSEGAFQKMAEMHKLRKAGDVDGAEKIREELGLPEMGRKNGNKGKRGKRNHKRNFADADNDGVCDNQ